jgi:hypothetical protein
MYGTQDIRKVIREWGGPRKCYAKMVYVSKRTWCSDLAILTSNSDSTGGVAWKVIPPIYNFPEQPGTAKITAMASRRTRSTGGRILLHERDVDNLVPIMGDKYNETLQHDMKDITRKDYRQRNIKVAKFWGEHCPEYYPVRTRDVLAEDLQDQRKFFHGRYKKDLVYKGLNVKYFIKFLMAIKKKENGNLLSFTDLRKYKDAIMWPVSMAEERLPTIFYEEIEKFLKGYKKELVKAWRDGNTDERAAGPILFALYHILLTWSVESNNIFVWFWMLA